MNISWYWLVLCAHMFWVLGTYIDKYLLDSYRCEDENTSDVGTFVLVSSAFMLLVAVVIYGIATTLSYFGIIEAVSFDLGMRDLLLALAVGVCDIGWLIPYLYALRDEDENEVSTEVVQVDPLFQIVPVFGFLFGFAFFEETFTWLQLLSGVVILVGSIVLNINLTKGSRASFGAFLNLRVIVSMSIASAVIALSGYVFESASMDGNYWGTLFWVSVGSVLAGIMMWACIPSYRRGFHAYIRRWDARSLQVNVLNEFADNIAAFAFYAAIMLGPSTAIVQSTMAYQPFFVFLAACFASLFRINRFAHQGWVFAVRALGIVLVVVGSVALYDSDVEVSEPVVVRQHSCWNGVDEVQHCSQKVLRGL